MYPNRACQGLVGLPGGLLTGCLAFAHTPGHTWVGHYVNSKVASDKDCMFAAAVGNMQQCMNVNASVHKRCSSVAICCGQSKYSLDASGLAVTLLHTQCCTELHHCMQIHIAISKRIMLTASLNNTVL